jgi:hypothetical protein
MALSSDGENSGESQPDFTEQPPAAEMTELTGGESLPESESVVPAPLEEPGEVQKRQKRRMVRMFVTGDQMKALWERASQAKISVDTSINDAALAYEMLDQISFARNELLAGEENYEHAERAINEVEYRVGLRKRVAGWSTSLGYWLFIYETAWAVVLLVFLFLVLGPTAFSASVAPGGSALSPDVVFLLGSMAWGGLGGVIGAWLSLIKHIAKDQDFDRQHTIWYVNSPVMGIGIGAVIYLIMRAGLLSLSGPGEAINSPLIIYLLAWLAGYQQNVFTDLVKRLLQVFKIEEEKTPVKPSVSHGAGTSELPPSSAQNDETA